MSRKDKILHQALEKNGLLTKYVPDSLIWNLITGCMQTYVEEQEVQQFELTIEEVTDIKEHKKKKQVTSCEHNWLKCSEVFWICSNCAGWKEL